MRNSLLAVLALVLLGVVGLVGFAVLTELPAPTREISLPVTMR